VRWVRDAGGDWSRYAADLAHQRSLQSGVDITVIALWLGHEDTATTHLYIEADLAMKTAALDRLKPPTSKSKRFKPPDDLLAFLEHL
jgi:integrase/recombinase XerD